MALVGVTININVPVTDWMFSFSTHLMLHILFYILMCTCSRRYCCSEPPGDKTVTLLITNLNCVDRQRTYFLLQKKNGLSNLPCFKDITF